MSGSRAKRPASSLKQRHQSVRSASVCDKRVTQWEELMKKFCEAHKEECHTVSLDIPKAHRAVKNLPTGSQYGGSWDVLGMAGYGTYTFPNGVVYKGDFEDGMFHGKGELQYDDGAVLKGRWKNGIMDERTLLFSDRLEYNEDVWKYCEMPDRRFAIEYDIDVMPAGKSLLTADQPTKEIPPGYYDTGDGFYDPRTKCIHKYDDLKAIVRSPAASELKWIVDNCRVYSDLPLGPRPDLYECWTDPVLEPAPTPPPAAGVKSPRISASQGGISDPELVDSDTTINFYDITRRQLATEGRPHRRYRARQQ